MISSLFRADMDRRQPAGGHDAGVTPAGPFGRCDVKHCPTCGTQMVNYPACVAGHSHCGMCGTLVNADGLEPVVPRFLCLMADFHAECLRDDRRQCAVYLMAAKVNSELFKGV